eukprot:Skav200887  [mRNA]  locus=scaffold1581:40043:56652:+ [translate_table: standard]
MLRALRSRRADCSCQDLLCLAYLAWPAFGETVRGPEIVALFVASGLNAWLMLYKAWLMREFVTGQNLGRWQEWFKALAKFPFAILASAMLSQTTKYVQARVSMLWRKTATSSLLRSYFSNMNYYKLLHHGSARIEDVDVRICSDVRSGCDALTGVLISGLSGVMMASFSTWALYQRRGLSAVFLLTSPDWSVARLVQKANAAYQQALTRVEQAGESVILGFSGQISNAYTAASESVNAMAAWIQSATVDVGLRPLECKGIEELLQARLSVADVKGISRFAVIGETPTDIRTFGVDHLTLNRGRDTVKLASLVDAWQACKVRMQTRHAAEAEATITKMPPPINKVEAQDLRIRFEQMFYRMDDKVCPSTGTLEQIFEQVEAGEWKVMALVEFMSREDQETEPLGAVIDRSGAVKVKKGYGESKPPAGSEDLRARLKLVGHTFMMAMLKYPNRAVLRDLSPNVFHKLSDYLLGEHVYGLHAKVGHEVLSSPSFQLVLNYEFQIRKKATQDMNRGMDMVTALDNACKDPVTKERYFLTPAAMAAAAQREVPVRKSRSPRRDVDMPREWPERTWSDRRSKGKGSGKKGKSSGKAEGRGRAHTVTPDGKPICFAWNNRDQRLLYLFAGAPRDTSVVHTLKKLASKMGWDLLALEVDIKRGPEFDLTSVELRESLLKRVRQGEFHAVLCTPPCSTWSRVRCANMRGPPPLRAKDHVWGFPWLTGRLARDAELGSLLVRFAIDVWTAVAQCPVSKDGFMVFLFGEHPEDLGLVIREEDGLRMVPASIWQLFQVRSLTNTSEGRIRTVAINQCCWGTPWRKPARLLSSSSVIWKWGPTEWPSFDDMGRYEGPLSKTCACQVSVSLARSSNHSGFRTSGTDIYPEALDNAIAMAIVDSLRSPAISPAKEGNEITGKKAEEGCEDGLRKRKEDQGQETPDLVKVRKEDQGQETPDLVKVRKEDQGQDVSDQLGEEEPWIGSVDGSPGYGPPLKCYYKGHFRTLHDGGGLCSPGRWPVCRRKTLKDKKAVGVASFCKRLFLGWIIKEETRKEGHLGTFWSLAG